MAEAVGFGRKITKLYVSIVNSEHNRNSIEILVRDGYGRHIEKHVEKFSKNEKNVDYVAAIKSLQISSKYCKNKVYIFTNNRSMLNQIHGSYAIKNKKTLKFLNEIRFLQQFFKCARFFYAGS